MLLSPNFNVKQVTSALSVTFTALHMVHSYASSKNSLSPSVTLTIVGHCKLMLLCVWAYKLEF